MWAAMSDILSTEPAGKKQYWVHVWGGRAQEDGGRDGLQGDTGRQGDGCGWGLSLPISSPLIWRPRIEPPINKSKSYLNTLPFSTDWGYGLHLSLPLISKARSPTFSPLYRIAFPGMLSFVYWWYHQYQVIWISGGILGSLHRSENY